MVKTDNSYVPGPLLPRDNHRLDHFTHHTHTDFSKSRALHTPGQSSPTELRSQPESGLSSETGSYCVVQTGLKLTILLPQHPECYNNRHVPPQLAEFRLFIGGRSRSALCLGDCCH
jgi:hypothetical protein